MQLQNKLFIASEFVDAETHGRIEVRRAGGERETQMNRRARESPGPLGISANNLGVRLYRARRALRRRRGLAS